MRLAYLLGDQGIPLLGTKGASVHARSITQALCALGHDVTCFVARLGEETDAPVGPTLRQVRIPSFPAELADIIIAETAAAGLPPAPHREIAGLALNEVFRRAVVEEHELRPFDALVERYSLWSCAGAWLARELGIPLVLEVNAPLLEEQARYRALTLAPVASAIRRQVFRTTSAVAAVSAEVARDAESAGADPDGVAVVANGYDAELFRPVANPGGPDGAFTVGFLGTLKPWHGIDALCRAFAELATQDATARLCLVGDGPMRGWVDGFAERSGLQDRIEIVGSKAHADIPAQLARFHVAVAPYPAGDDFYFSPLKIYEYMGSGLPIVASDVGQVGEVLDHERTALLVPPGDEAALAAALRRLRDEPDTRVRLAGAAAETARQRHRWEDVARRLVEVIEGASRPAPPRHRPDRSRRAGRVAYVLKRYPRLSETFIVSELLGVERFGQQVRIFASSAPKEAHVHPAVQDVRAEVTYTKRPARRRLRKDPTFEAPPPGVDESALPELAAAARESDAEGGPEEALRELAQACEVAGEAVRTSVGHLHAHFATAATRIAALAARLAGISFSFTPHAKDIFRTDVDLDVVRGLLDQAAFVVAISEDHRAFLRNLHPTVRIELVRNGIDLRRFPWQGDGPRSKRPVRMLGVGRLVEKKGFDDLVRACAVLRDRSVDVECRIVGEGEERAGLELLIDELGLEDQCRLEGACTQEQLPQFLTWGTALLAPCITAESGDRDGLPTVILEAMATGLPVISTPVTAIPEIVRDGETGVLVPERSPDALADAALRLADDPDGARVMARAARQAVEELHDNRRNAARLAGLFREAATCA